MKNHDIQNPDPTGELFGGLPDSGGLFDTVTGGRRGRITITPNRTENFSLQTGQFRNQPTGRFEPGGPPEDYDGTANRFRATDGQFKDNTQDHFDEPAEVLLESTEPRG